MRQDLSRSSLEPLFFLLFSRYNGSHYYYTLNHHLNTYTLNKCRKLTSTHQYFGALSSKNKSEVWKNTFHYLCRKGATLSEKMCCCLIETALNSSSMTSLSRFIE